MTWAVILGCHFFPSIIAACRHHHNALAVLTAQPVLGLDRARLARRADLGGNGGRAQCRWPDRMTDIVVTALVYLSLGRVSALRAPRHLDHVVSVPRRQAHTARQPGRQATATT
jgi:hypothetical protein